MTTNPLFLNDPYLRDAPATVTALTEEGGIVLDQTVFYATSGGQPGDSGLLEWSRASGGLRKLEIATTIKGPDGALILVPAEAQALPPVGAAITQHLDWDRRYRHMRMHTALHLLSVVIPLPVTGGAIGADRSRLDFAMPDPPEDVAGLEAALNALIARDLTVSDTWITDADLDANPGLVKTLSVQPPRGSGRIRLVRIGTEIEAVDLQPCGGTHVARTGEIGPVQIVKVENKGKQNRRVSLVLAQGPGLA
jgi:misacylated tRNA(Ala) deacylase